MRDCDENGRREEQGERCGMNGERRGTRVKRRGKKDEGRVKSKAERGLKGKAEKTRG